MGAEGHNRANKVIYHQFSSSRSYYKVADLTNFCQKVNDLLLCQSKVGGRNTVAMVRVHPQTRQQPTMAVDSSNQACHQPALTPQTMSSLKRRRISSSGNRPHSLSHIQQLPAQTEPAPQDEVFVQSQLLRSICTALAVVGYDSVKPSALEMFRAQVEECG